MGKLTVEFKHGFEDIVYLKTDINQVPRMVLEMSIASKNCVQYKLAEGDSASWHYEIELSSDKDIVLTSTH